MIYRFCAWQLSRLNDGSMQMELGLFESCSVVFTWLPTALLNKTPRKICVRLVLQ